MKEKFIFKAKVDNTNLKEIIEGAGIQFPNPALSFYRSVFANVSEEANLNGVRLAESVAKDVPQLIGCQANWEHLRRGFVAGSIIHAIVNSDKNIEIVFSLYKTLYEKENERLQEAVKNGEANVSFELVVDKNDVIHNTDGTKTLKHVQWEGVGILLDNPPAFEDAVIFEQAKIDSLRELDLVFAKKLNRELIQQFEGKYWSTKYVNNLPNSSFAVIEPAYLEGTSTDKRCRHLAFKDAKGNVSDVHFRQALIKAEKLMPITDSILIDELRAKASEALEKIEIQFQSQEEEETQVDIKTNDAILAEFKKNIIAEFGEEAVKDWVDDDFQNEEKIQALRESLEPKEAKTEVAEVTTDEPESEEAKVVVETKIVETYEDDGTEKVDSETKITRDGEVTFQEKVSVERVYSAEEVEAIKAEYEAQIASIKETAKQIAELRVELADYAKDLTDEDLCNEDKVKIARLTKEIDKLKNAKSEIIAEVTEEAVKTEETASKAEDVELETGHALVNDEDDSDVKLKDYIKAKYNKITK